MKYLVNPNNRFNNQTSNLIALCVDICKHTGCNHTETCGNKTLCNSKCRIRTCYCKVGNSRFEINSTGSFI